MECLRCGNYFYVDTSNIVNWLNWKDGVGSVIIKCVDCGCLQKMTFKDYGKITDNTIIREKEIPI